MLLDYPKTDINLKSDGGITPLMDAVKTTNMYMVEQLVKKNADISLTDQEGESFTTPLKYIRAHLDPGSACVNCLYTCHILYLWHIFLMGHTANF